MDEPKQYTMEDVHPGLSGIKLQIGGTGYETPQKQAPTTPPDASYPSPNGRLPGVKRINAPRMHWRTRFPSFSHLLPGARLQGAISTQKNFSI